MTESKLNETAPQQNLWCSHCGKGVVDGYDLTIYSDRLVKRHEKKSFCSINCLARWVGERGWVYELQLRGIHAPEQAVEKPVQYASKD